MEINVKSGDTLTNIAKRYGTTVENLAAANGIQDINKISVGQVLTIPGDAFVSKAKGTAPLRAPGELFNLDEIPLNDFKTSAPQAEAGEGGERGVEREGSEAGSEAAGEAGSEAAGEAANGEEASAAPAATPAPVVMPTLPDATTSTEQKDQAPAVDAQAPAPATDTQAPAPTVADQAPAPTSVQATAKAGAVVNGLSAREIDALTRAVAAEARGESPEAWTAVAQTIINYARQNHKSITSLTRSSYLSSNFDGNSKYYSMPASRIPNYDQMRQAVLAAARGESPIGNATHFHDISINTPSFGDKNSRVQIGKMVFYSEKGQA